MSSKFHNAGLGSQSHGFSSVLSVNAGQPLKVALLALLCALPFGLAFIPQSLLAPYVTLVAFVPAMYVVRRLAFLSDAVSFALVCSLAANALVTCWLPVAVHDVLGGSYLSALFSSLLLWLCWSTGMALFLLFYRRFHRRCFVPVACLGVALFNYWPSVFGVNPFASLIYADTLSGSSFFLGVMALQLIALLMSGYLVSAVIAVSHTPLYRAALLVSLLLVVDLGSSLYLHSAPANQLNVALVQAGNVYPEKFSSAAHIEKFAQQIVDAEPIKPDLIVFPESVFTFNFAYDPDSANAAIEALERFSLKERVAFLLSTVQAVDTAQPAPPGQNKITRISSLLVNEGQVQGVADKARTIPFAEYTPGWAVGLVRWLGMGVELRAPGTRYEQALVKGVRIIPLSCFESLDQRLVQKRLNGRPGLLVTQSNMDNFGSPGSVTYRATLWQHMSYEQQWSNQWQVPLVRAVKGGGSTRLGADGAIDLDLLEQSWGREWVATSVSVRNSLALDSVASFLREAIHWLIMAGAACCVWHCLGSVLNKRRKHYARSS